MSRKVFVLLFLFVLSRILYINSDLVFFDSPEYLGRFSNSNYFQAISSGHLPFHVGYILLFWPIFHLATFLNINPAFTVILAQIIFSAVALFCFYSFLRTIVSKKIAVISAVIFSLTPLYWITNVSIMTESTYINFFLISLFFLAQSVRRKTYSNLYLSIGCITFGLALLTNPLIILWIPFLSSVLYFLKKRKIITNLFPLFLTIVLVILVNSFFISYTLHAPLHNGIYQYFFGVDIGIKSNVPLTLAVLRFVRNTFTPIPTTYTTIVFILGIISLIKLFNKNKKLFITALLWIAPFIITNQWFDSLLFGRHGIIAGLGFAFLAGIFLEKRKILFFSVIGYILLVSLPALTLLKQPIPYLETAKFVKMLPKGLLIETHFARPQVEDQYSGETIFVNQPGWNKNQLSEKINFYLNSNKPIFITSQALSDPYGVYSGPFLYSLSLSYAKKFELEDILSSYKLSLYAQIDKDANIAIFKIVSKGKLKYPNIPNLSSNRHRIDYFDPLNQFWFLLERAKIIQSQSIIKG